MLETVWVAFGHCEFSFGLAFLEFLVSTVALVDNRMTTLALSLSPVVTVLTIVSNTPFSLLFLSIGREFCYGTIVPVVISKLFILLEVLAVHGVIS